MFRRKSQPIQEIVQQLIREQGLETPLLQKRLMDSWSEVVGPMAAQYSEVQWIKEDKLYVHFTNASLRADFSMMRSELVKKLNAKVGSQIITDIVLR